MKILAKICDPCPIIQSINRTNKRTLSFQRIKTSEIIGPFSELYIVAPGVTPADSNAGNSEGGHITITTSNDDIKGRSSHVTIGF